MIFYGAPVREKIRSEIKSRVEKLGFKPRLAIVQVGDRPDSNIYVSKKINFGLEVGVEVVLKKFQCSTNSRIHTNDTNQERVIAEIRKLNEDKNINGIIVQLPLPKDFDTAKVVNVIDKLKDADGLRENAEAEGVLVTPATARAVLTLLDYYNVDIKNKKAVVLGRSRLAGGPIGKLLREMGAEVVVCHRGTQNIPTLAKKADLLVSAVGQPSFVNRDFVNENQIVIDVGINRIQVSDEKNKNQEKIVGDVNFDEVVGVVKAISPVPGGVGPLTVACLFENLLDLCDNQNN